MRKTESIYFPGTRAAILATVVFGSGWLTGCVTQNEVVRSPVTPLETPSTATPSTSPIVPSTAIPSTSPTVVPGTATPSTSPTVVPGTVTPSASPTSETSLNLYWLKDNGKKLELVPSPVRLEGTNNPSNRLQATFQALLTGPIGSQFSSAIPQGTKLRSLEIKADGVHVDFSQEFTSGGGSASMTGRLGQVVYTATALDPKASVWINVEGKKLEVLGGEGLEIEQPLTRAKFREDFDF
jgi:spore germination protein GerM